MLRSTYSATYAQAAASASARSCAAHAGYSWRFQEMCTAFTATVKQNNSKKRTARRLGLAST